MKNKTIENRQGEINNILFKACGTFRNIIPSSQYKDYILVMLFFKYVSDIYKEKKQSYMEKFNANEEMVNKILAEESFKLEEKATFDYIYNNRKKPIKTSSEGVIKSATIGEMINIALDYIEEKNAEKLRNVFRNVDFNSETITPDTAERNSMLKTLLEDFNKLDLSPSKLGDEDIIGNSYEYLIEYFASDSGKKGGEYYSPAMVSTLIAKLLKPQEEERIYDPTCGSGSLLLKAFKEVPNKKAALYGQEMNGQTHSLCKMNMFLHNVYDATIEQGDTLANPKILENDQLMKFNTIVANPPFSFDKWAKGFLSEEKAKMSADLDRYNRFAWGVPPASKGDFAFVLHMLKSLNEQNGKMGVVLPHGVLFRGSSEGKIRQKILEENLLDAVIGLPANLFFGTSIPTCILIFRKNRTHNNILFIDASSSDYCVKEKNQNKLKSEHVEKIVKLYEDYKTVDKTAYLATPEEIKENDYNLNIPRYVDTFEEEELIDMDEVKTNIANIKKELSEVEKQMESYLKELGL